MSGSFELHYEALPGPTVVASNGSAPQLFTWVGRTAEDEDAAVANVVPMTPAMPANRIVPQRNSGASGSSVTPAAWRSTDMSPHTPGATSFAWLVASWWDGS